MNSVNCNTTYTVTASFTDENGLPLTPISARYRVDDVASGTVVVPWTTLTPTSPSVPIVVTAAQNAIINPALSVETRVVTLDFQYSSSGQQRQGAGEYRYNVENITGEAKP
jgi:hypothetical protein